MSSKNAGRIGLAVVVAYLLNIILIVATGHGCRQFRTLKCSGLVRD